MLKYYEVKDAASVLNISDKAIYKKIEEQTIPFWRYKNNTIVGIENVKSSSNTRVISLINIKGGVAKTTTAVNVSTFLALMGFKVLLIDTDHQNQCILFFKLLTPQYTVKDVFFDDINIQDCIHKTEVHNLDIIPSDHRIGILEKGLNNYNRLKERIEPIKKDYDFIIIDNSPSLNSYNINAIIASDYILIPSMADELSFDGIKHLLEALKGFTSNANISIIGVVHTIFEKNLVICNDYRNNFKKVLDNYLLDTIIHKNVSLKELATKRQNIFTYTNPRNSAYKDYRDLTIEILKRV